MATIAKKNIEKILIEMSADIFLRKLEYQDKKKVCKWMSKPYIVQNSFVVPGPSFIPSDFATEKYSERYFEHLITDSHRETFAVLYKNQHVGNVGLKEINIAQGTADCFIEIGEDCARGKGVGQEAMSQMLYYGFFVRNLIEINLDVLEFNIVAIKLYEKLGFTNQRQISWHYDEYGQYWRVIRMNLKRSEFRWVASSKVK